MRKSLGRTVAGRDTAEAQRYVGALRAKTSPALFEKSESATANITVALCIRGAGFSVSDKHGVGFP